MSLSPHANEVKWRASLQNCCDACVTLSDMTDTPDSLVREFISRLVARDLDSAAGMVSDDFEYDNVPMGKAFGPDGLKNTLTGFFAMCTAIDWEILRQTSTGDLTHGVVLNERDDRVEIHGRWATLPVAGVFEIREGKLVLWRDYFDRQTIIEVMTPPQA
jgi:limonene-1,2-epoxide hydrolase